jgi:adenosine deaminase
MRPESIWQTIEHLRPSRIGHGVRAIEDQRLVSCLAHEAMPLEVCLTSNVKLGVYPSYTEHHVKRLVDAGCTISLIR